VAVGRTGVVPLLVVVVVVVVLDRAIVREMSPAVTDRCGPRRRLGGQLAFERRDARFEKSNARPEFRLGGRARWLCFRHCECRRNEGEKMFFEEKKETKGYGSRKEAFFLGCHLREINRNDQKLENYREWIRTRSFLRAVLYDQ
jgi:hypothetical protein